MSEKIKKEKYSLKVCAKSFTHAIFVFLICIFHIKYTYMHYIHIKSFLKVAVLDLKKKPFHKNSKYVTVKKNKNKMSK